VQCLPADHHILGHLFKADVLIQPQRLYKRRSLRMASPNVPVLAGFGAIGFGAIF
jgi:hypothetical protein